MLKSFAPCDIVVTNYLGTYAMNKWDKRFMEMARLVSSWSSCYKENRQVGAVIVRDKRILTTGYNGAGSGIKSCKERGECIRVKKGIASGTCHEICYAVHAEQNAIIQAAKIGVSVDGAILYCTHQPCSICAKMIINSGIKKVIFDEGYPDDFSIEMFKEAGVEFIKYKDLEKE
jgi:dCMP deaminase